MTQARRLLPAPLSFPFLPIPIPIPHLSLFHKLLLHQRYIAGKVTSCKLA